MDSAVAVGDRHHDGRIAGRSTGRKEMTPAFGNEVGVIRRLEALRRHCDDVQGIEGVDLSHEKTHAILRDGNRPVGVIIPDIDQDVVVIVRAHIVHVFLETGLVAAERRDDDFLDFAHVVGTELMRSRPARGLEVVAHIRPVESKYAVAAGGAVLADMDARRQVAGPPPGRADGAHVVLFERSRRQFVIEHFMRMGRKHLDIVVLDNFKELGRIGFTGGAGTLPVIREFQVRAGIEDGDIVVCRKQISADEGDIVVALVDGESTLKRFFIDRKNKCFILHPENEEYEDIIVEELYIQGVATHVIKKLGNAVGL